MSDAVLGPTPRIGIIGAGRAGTAIARALTAADIDVDLCSTRPPKALQHHLKIYAPGTTAVEPENIASGTLSQGPGIVILAVPQEELDEVETSWPQTAILIDATNHWRNEPVPSWLSAAISEQMPTSMAIASKFPENHVVKTFNHIAHSHFDRLAKPQEVPEKRHTMALAGDDPRACAVVEGLIQRIGFTPELLGSLAAGKAMEPGGPYFNRELP